MHDLMLEADLAIGAGGTTSWERCCLGLPTIMIEIAENQRFVSKALHDLGAAHNLGQLDKTTPEILSGILAHYVDSQPEIQTMSKKCTVVCNGRGTDHILPVLVANEPLKNGKSLHLRFMSIEDTDIIYKWQSHPGLRQYSRNSAIPSKEEHAHWMSSSLNNIARYHYIIMQDQTPVGIIRLDKIEEGSNRYEISIMIAPNATKQGIASVAHKLLRKLHPDIEIVAEVHPENTASVALFKKMNYKPLSERCFLLTSQ